MKGSEVLKALEEGKKMRKVDWRQNEYIELYNNELIDEEGDNQEECVINMFLKDGWEEYIKLNHFKIGDYVKVVDRSEQINGMIFKIKCMYDSKLPISEQERLGLESILKSNIKSLLVENLVLATDKEVEQELRRKKWQDVCREVEEFKVGDIVSDKNGRLLYICLVENFNRQVNCKYLESDNNEYPYPFHMEDISLVCPVENRFDKVK